MGGTGPTPAACKEFSEQYERELVAARSCDDKGNGKDAPCAALVPASLAGCDSLCFTYVDKPKKLNDLKEKWTKAGCAPDVCPGFLCVAPLTSLCTPLTGVCTDLL